MNKILKLTTVLVGCMFTLSWAQLAFSHDIKTITYTVDRGFDVDERSFQLGQIRGYCSFVSRGLKSVAVSTTYTKADMDVLFPDFKIIADSYGIGAYRDSTPLETDLFTIDRPEIAVFYTGDVLEQYLALKAHQKKLIDNGEYVGAARRDVAVRFGKIMGYSDESIENWLSSN